MDKALRLLRKYRGLLSYGFFGVLTTVVNAAIYYIAFNVINMPNIPATMVASIVAVAFAFITNKIWVFDSRSFDAGTLKHEIPTFFGARIVTGLLDILIMYVAVDLLKQDALLWKMISNILVIVINYVASKVVIFNKKKGDKGEVRR